MKELDYMKAAAKVSRKFTRNGGFLTVQHGSTINTMTVSWWNIGYMWAMPVLTVMVRKSRYTFELLEQAGDFTLSIPAPDLPKKLAEAGRTTGRGTDKISNLGLNVRDARRTATPVLAIPGVHYECRIALKTAMDDTRMAENVAKKYSNDDYHTFYFGEILACYKTKK